MYSLLNYLINIALVRTMGDFACHMDDSRSPHYLQCGLVGWVGNALASTRFWTDKEGLLSLAVL